MQLHNNDDFTDFDIFDKDFDAFDKDFANNEVDILKSFPKGRKLRDNQSKILKEYEELTKSYDKIIINDPVGGGKTFVGYTILTYYSPGFMVTATKGLQDQVIGDFPSIADMRGKNNFKCPQRMDTKSSEYLEKLITIKDMQNAGMTADYGVCSKTVRGETEYCKYYKMGKPDEFGNYIKQCDYRKQYQLGMCSSKTLINYAMYFNLVRMGAKGIHRRISIFDEAHTIGDQIVNQIGDEITQHQLQDCGLNANDFKLPDFDQTLRLLGGLSNGYTVILEKKDGDPFAYPKLNAEKISKRIEKIDRLYSEMEKNPDNFSINYPDELPKTLTIKPIDLTKYVKQFIKSPKQVFLSGTIDNHYFLKYLGLDPDEYGFIDNEKSNYTADARKIEFTNVASMSTRNWTKENQIKIYKKISEILTKYKDQRGVIHTSSKGECENIKKYFSKTEHKNRIIIIHSGIDDSTVDELLKKHAETPNSVILSPSFWMGYDLKGDLATFQIMVKFPRANWGDPWVQKRKRQYSEWYVHQAIIKTLQGFGRVVRTSEDKAITYCLDSDIQQELNNHPEMVQKSYWDVVFPEKQMR